MVEEVEEDDSTHVRVGEEVRWAVAGGEETSLPAFHTGVSQKQPTVRNRIAGDKEGKQKRMGVRNGKEHEQGQ